MITTEAVLKTTISDIDTSTPPSTTAPDDSGHITITTELVLATTTSENGASTPPSTTAFDLEFPTTMVSERDVSAPPSTTGLEVMGRTLSTSVISPQSHSDAGAIVGGAVAIVFIITAGVVTVLLSRTILKHFQSQT